MSYLLDPPSESLKACVVVPCRDEQSFIGPCLAALARQHEIGGDDYEVLVVLDDCSDTTEVEVLHFARSHELRVLLLRAHGDGPGPARRVGMDAACVRLHEVGRPLGLIACTDADSTVAPDWLARQLAAVGRGARAIGGRVEMSDAGKALLPPAVTERRRRQARARLEALRARVAPGDAATIEHWQFSGASMAVTAEVYQSIGGLEPKPVLEDEAFERVLDRAGVPVERRLDVKVTTSARVDGRAFRGLSRDLAVSSWIERRSFRGNDFRLNELLADKTDTVSLVLPTREVAETIDGVLDVVVPFHKAGLLDEIIVVDAASSDGTPEKAEAHGVTVVQESDVLPDFGRGRGKGDAMWRGLASSTGDIVAYADTDTEDFSSGFVIGLLGPLLGDRSIKLVKGAFRRALQVGHQRVPDEGGRVTELVARPFLNLYVPELAGFVQPLAGEIAARRELLESISFPVGYGVEIGMMIDAARLEGVDALAQVDLGERQNRHQRLRDLTAMAYAVLTAGSVRVFGPDAIDRFGPGPLVLPFGDIEVRQVPVEERPPLASLDRR